MARPADAAPDIERITDFTLPETVEAPGDAETAGLDNGLELMTDPAGGRDDTALTQRPVRDLHDLGSDEPGQPPVRPWGDFGTDRDDVNVVAPFEGHLTDEYNAPRVPFGETITRGVPERSIGQRVMERAADVVRTTATGGAESTAQVAQRVERLGFDEDEDDHPPEGGMTNTQEPSARTTDEAGGDHVEETEDRGAGDAAVGNDNTTEGPNNEGAGGNKGNGGGRGKGPESGEPDDDGDPGDDDDGHEDKKGDAAETGPADGRPVIPSQRVGEGYVLADNATETGDKEATEEEAARRRDEAHADNLADLKNLSTLTAVRVSPGGRANNALHFELAHNGQDASEYLAELASDLRSGSTEMPRIENWRDELTGPDKLIAGQVLEVGSVAELDELLARVGGWLNNDVRETKGYGGKLERPNVGSWRDDKYRPLALFGNVRDLRGRLFNGRQVNIEAMALPAELRGHTPFTRYFVASSQLKSTGRPPEESRPMRLMSVSAIPGSYKANNITAKSTEIGRVPAAVSAWLIDSRSRQIGHDIEYENRQFPLNFWRERPIKDR